MNKSITDIMKINEILYFQLSLSFLIDKQKALGELYIA